MTETRVKWKLFAVLFAISGIVGLFLMPNFTNAAINSQINFQGKLTNPDGTNVANGSYSIRFRIYTSAAPTDATNACLPGSNTCKWEDTQSLTVTDGIFNYALGSNVAATLPGSVDFTNSGLYLGVKVAADAEMTPRIQFTAAPYAFNASNAENLGGVAAASFVQLSPSGQQTGNINISGSVSAGSSLTFTTASAATIQSAASQALNITGNAASTFSTSAGQLTLQSGTGTISLGTSTTLTANGALSIVSATTNAVSLDSGTTGAVNVGAGANAKAITVGNTTAGTTIAEKIGTGATAYTIQGASNTFLAINGTSNAIYIGGSASAATPTLLVLGSKTATGDPTGAAGALYYNTADGDFKAYQANSGWGTVQPLRYVYLGSDVSRAATTYVDVTGMSFSVAANTNYEMTCNVIYRSAATTTGIGLALNGPASPTLVAGQFASNSTATAFNGRSFNAYNGTGKTTGVTTANTDTYGLFTAYFRNGATAGTLTLRVASETTTAVIVRAGTFCKLAEL